MGAKPGNRNAAGPHKHRGGSHKGSHHKGHKGVHHKGHSVKKK